MELERSTQHHHRQQQQQQQQSSSTASELFICFTSRLINSSSSNSMRLSKPSSLIHSPGRTDSTNNNKPPISSLSASLSRRLRSRNGSLRGAQSPMFPPGAVKKKGCSTFDNPEPSSPKVTCIGQVRVKTKKQGKKMKMNMRACRSKRRSSGSRSGSAEPSFRRGEVVGGGLSRQPSRRVQYQRRDEEEYRRRDSERERDSGSGSGSGCFHNQRWVHLSICDALKAFDCLFPCKTSSCFSSCSDEREKTERRDYQNQNQQRREGNSTSGSCGGSMFRWLVALSEGEGKGRDIELVMGGGEEDNTNNNNNRGGRGGVEGGGRVEWDRSGERVVMERECSRRRSIFDDMDFEEIRGEDDTTTSKDETFGGGNGIQKEDETAAAAGRVSICVPPKNALLLMRCRSDPVKMAALANRFWESPARKGEEEESDEDDWDDDDGGGCEVEEEEQQQRLKRKLVVERHRLSVGREAKVHDVEMIEKGKDLRGEFRRKVKSLPSSPQGEEEGEDRKTAKCAGLKIKQQEEDNKKVDISRKNLTVERNEPSIGEREMSELVLRLFDYYLLEAVKGLELVDEASRESQFTMEVEFSEKDHNFERITAQKHRLSFESSDQRNGTTTTLQENKKTEDESKLKPVIENAAVEEVAATNKENGGIVVERKSSSSADAAGGGGGLPDCLLLMMCEPKLSMEVSKETWVRTTDFIRCLPERHRQHHLKKVKPMVDDVGRTENKPTISTKTTTTAAVKEEEEIPQPQPQLHPIPKKKNSRPPKFPTTESEVGKVILQPGRSSCSIPAGVAKQYGNAAVRERKRGGGGGGGGGYEPSGLTRCKSAPMRSATAKLAGAAAAAAAAAKQGDLTAWKNRRMEPHRPATCGVGF